MSFCCFTLILFFACLPGSSEKGANIVIIIIAGKSSTWAFSGAADIHPGSTFRWPFFPWKAPSLRASNHPKIVFWFCVNFFSRAQPARRSTFLPEAVMITKDDVGGIPALSFSSRSRSDVHEIFFLFEGRWIGCAPFLFSVSSRSTPPKCIYFSVSFAVGAVFTELFRTPGTQMIFNFLSSGSDFFVHFLSLRQKVVRFDVEQTSWGIKCVPNFSALWKG